MNQARSERGPDFYAWCDEADRFDAFAAALSALVYPGGLCDVSLSTPGSSEHLWRSEVPLDEVIALTRPAFKARSEMHVNFGTKWRWLARFGLSLNCYGEEHERRWASGPLRVHTYEWKGLYPYCLEIAIGDGVRSVEAEAAMISMQFEQDMEEILLGLCAPDARPRVTTGACSAASSWSAPVEACATYHADAASVARDLALSWLHIHDGDLVERAASLSMDALRARVEAAPRGARVGVASTVERVDEHWGLDRDASRSRAVRPTRADAVRRVPRARLVGDEDLTREQVLAALSMPPATLVGALEASAVPDEAWRSVEPRARELVQEIIEEPREGEPSYEVNVATGRHVRFIERHSPYYVRRLPNGGLLLATHPFRTLWPLWSDALFVLGLMS
ncbi:hypothetical protein [Sorangium sp. So ce1389]|uniref:hypothetical protein n=1 Tax=Sorangium sp. So ce1389 TaxID=3133336 RepID=UPI003F5FCACC